MKREKLHTNLVTSNRNELATVRLNVNRNQNEYNWHKKRTQYWYSIQKIHNVFHLPVRLLFIGWLLCHSFAQTLNLLDTEVEKLRFRQFKKISKRNSTRNSGDYFRSIIFNLIEGEWNIGKYAENWEKHFLAFSSIIQSLFYFFNGKRRFALRFDTLLIRTNNMCRALVTIYYLHENGCAACTVDNNTTIIFFYL